MLPSPFRPSAASIAAFLDAASRLSFSGAVERLIAGDVPPGFVNDRNGRQVGRGPGAFAAAREALAAWRMFHLGWIEVVPPDSPIEAGRTVAILARTFGAWSLNPARLVRVTDNPHEFSFTYGSLPGHSEEGVETFAVKRDPADDTVSYSLSAWSRPGRFFTRLAYPLTRRVQARFVRDSMSEMARFVERGAGP